MHHLFAVLASILWLSLNVFLWSWIKSTIGLFAVSILLGIGYFAAFFWYGWYGSRRSS